MTATNIANAVQTPISQLPGRMTGYGSNSAGNFNSSVSGWAGTVQQTAFRLYEFFSNQLGSGLSSNMTTWGYNAGEKFNSGINSRSSAISTTVQAIVTGITTKFTNLAAAMQSAGTNAMINFSNGFVNKYNSSFVGYMNTIVNGIKNRLDIQNSLNILGYNAGIGFNNGLFSASSYIYSTAQTIANNVKNKISAALEINSPSKVLERIGQFTGKGFEIGLEESAEGIYSTMNDIGQRLAEGMNQDVNIGMNAISSEYSTQRAGTAEAASPELNNMATLLAQYLPYLPYLAQQTNVVLDDGTLVGKIAPAMNNALSDINRRAARG